jgi:transposase
MDEKTNRLIEGEKNVEVLQAWVKYTFSITRQLEEQNARLRTLIEEKEAAKLVLLAGFTEDLTSLRKLIFGRKSEKRAKEDSADRDQEEERLLLHSETILPPPKESQVKPLPTEEVVHEIPPADLKVESELRGLANASESQWEKIEGLYEKSTEVTVIERSYKVITNKRAKYRLKPEANDSGKEVIITAPYTTDRLLPGCEYSVSFAVSVVADKFVSHMPYERQTKEMQSLGLRNMKTKTLCNFAAVVAAYLEPVVEMIKKDLLASKRCLHLDETTWPIQIKEQDDGYMWAASNADAVYFCFEPTRSGSIIKDFLGTDYEGIVMADGYKGYNFLNSREKVKLARCWVHARRNFFKIKDTNPQCNEVLDLIDRLFALEHRAKDWDELRRLRNEESRILMELIQQWLEEKSKEAIPETKFYQAIKYCHDYWNGLTLFLTDVRVPLSNNDVERSIRHAVMGRKNAYGSRNHNGADVAGIMYTIIGSCKKIGLDARTYIDWALRQAIRSENLMTPFEYAKRERSQ